MAGRQWTGAKGTDFFFLGKMFFLAKPFKQSVRRPAFRFFKPRIVYLVGRNVISMGFYIKKQIDYKVSKDKEIVKI